MTICLRSSRTLQTDPNIVAIADCTLRQRQITLQPHSSDDLTNLSQLVETLSQTHHAGRLNYVRSGHSIDILAPGVSKLALVEAVSALSYGNDSGTVLCMGDRGRWPGNDYALLREAHALSVHEVSPDPNTCWNISPAGYRGVQAALYYLERLTMSPASRYAQYTPRPFDQSGRS